MKNEHQEVPKSNCNKTDINNTDYSKTDFNQTDNSEKGYLLSHPIYPPSLGTEEMMGRMEDYRQLIRERIAYEALLDWGDVQKQADELVELMTEVMMTPDEDTIRIAGMNKPAAVVKSRFMKLGYSHMQYVLDSLAKNTTKVGNIKAYLLTTLYNASLTIDSYYQAEVNHDMYGSG